MPVGFKLLSEPPLLHVWLSGKVGLPDLLDRHKRYGGDPGFQPGVDELFDIRGATEIDLTFTQMRTLRHKKKAYYAQAPHKVRCAIIAPGDVQFGMGRMYATLADLAGDQNVEVFRKADLAMAFLGISDSDLAQQLTEKCAAK